MIRQVSIAVCASVLASCASPHGKIPDLVQTTVAEPGAGQLVVTANRGVTISGWRRHLVNVSWQRYCALHSDYNCDPQARYDMQIGLDSQGHCWSQVYGVVVPKAPAPGRKPVGVQVDFICLGAGFDLLPTSMVPYAPGESPPILYFDCPPGGWSLNCAAHRNTITTVPVIITRRAPETIQPPHETH